MAKKQQNFHLQQKAEKENKLQQSKTCQNCAIQIEKKLFIKDQHQQQQKEIAYKSAFF